MQEIKQMAPNVKFVPAKGTYPLRALALKHRVLAGSRMDPKRMRRWIAKLEAEPDPIYQRLAKKYGVQVAEPK